MITVSYKIFPIEWYNGDAGSDPLNSRIMDKMKAVITVTGQKNSLGSSWIFLTGAKTITIDNDVTDASVVINSEDLTNKYLVGETIVISGTASNNGTFTITAVNASYLTVAEAVTSETAYVVNIRVSSKPTALDFYFNLIPNSSPENYFSLTDKRTFQRYSVSGLNPADVVTHSKFSVSTLSNAWVTDALTVEVSECDIIGAGVSDTYVWTFTITHTFFQSPFFLREQVSNFQNTLIPPDLFSGGSALKYIARFDAKYTASTPIIEDTGSVTSVIGSATWFNSASLGTRPVYSLDYITYKDTATAAAMTKLDMSKTVDVEIGIKASSALFDSINTVLVLNHIYCPMDESVYMDTQTTQRQNFMNDRVKCFLGAGALSDYHGTNYQVITGASATFIDATHCKINFTCDYATALKTILKAKSATDKQYAFSVTTQNQALTSTTNIDRVCILADFQNADYGTDDTTLLVAGQPTSGGFLVYPFPNINTSPYKNIAGFEGDLFYVQFPFCVKTTTTSGVQPIIKKAGFQIIAKKTGLTDFVIEEKIFDVTGNRKLKPSCDAEGIQSISLSETRGFTTFANDIFNQVALFRDKQYDVAGFAAFTMQYGFALRYEAWRNIFDGLIELNTDIADDNEVISEQWTALINCSWSLALRFTADIIGYDGNVTNFTADCAITIKNINANSQDDPTIIDNTKTTQRFFDENDIEIKCIKADGITRVITDYYGNFANIPAAYTHTWGYAFADNRNNGGIFTRRFANTEYVSESDSPFSPALPYDIPDTSGTAGNIQISTYSTTRVTVSFFYDATRTGWRRYGDTILPQTRIGWSVSGAFDNSFDASFDI